MDWCSHAQILITEQHGPLRGGEEAVVDQGIEEETGAGAVAGARTWRRLENEPVQHTA